MYKVIETKSHEEINTKFASLWSFVVLRIECLIRLTQGWASQAISRVESSPSQFKKSSSQVESSHECFRVESSRVKIFFLLFHNLFISIKNINKKFITHNSVPSFHTQKK
jgi:hypothetical protein